MIIGNELFSKKITFDSCYSLTIINQYIESYIDIKLEVSNSLPSLEKPVDTLQDLNSRPEKTPLISLNGPIHQLLKVTNLMEY